MCHCYMASSPHGGDEGISDLRAHEFFASYVVHPFYENICNFQSQSNQKLAKFERHHSNARQWQRECFLIFRIGCKYPYSEALAG